MKTNSGDAGGIQVSGMQFSYDGQPPLFVQFDLEVTPGSRCLLIGANGSGKTTLLKILAGKHMVGGRDVVRVLNCSAFHDTQLICGGDLPTSVVRGIKQLGDVPLQGDFSAEHMIFGVEGVDPTRREKLIDLLDIDLQWRMHKVSDGQRRRVQICMGLLHPFKVLLLDEITVDLDVVTRMDLLDFSRRNATRGATIVYATHIFDGLETWATHAAYIQDGELRRSERSRSSRDEGRQELALCGRVVAPRRDQAPPEGRRRLHPFRQLPFRSSRHMAYFR
ncbi:unnamed protein product [Spirodela intermedia]|uniref:ABC transporter domain-containing protein n=1 Tax=Spirodela intermedia TaxID=51605 RepID=A0A7I8IEK1_SPIIN|nr:unnamed protein product [Spirodela intermedia]CAA6655292.1 unnamed protein product [Spirodela intermedia]